MSTCKCEQPQPGVAGCDRCGGVLPEEASGAGDMSFELTAEAVETRDPTRVRGRDWMVLLFGSVLLSPLFGFACTYNWHLRELRGVRWGFAASLAMTGLFGAVWLRMMLAGAPL